MERFRLLLENNDTFAVLIKAKINMSLFSDNFAIYQYLHYMVSFYFKLVN